MTNSISGKVWKFEDNVDTDQLAPGHSFELEWEQRKSVLLPTRPGFTAEFSTGDVIVARKNWGCGSSREQAVENLQLLGASAVIAESFARIFFRNAIAMALPAIVCPGVYEAFNEGDELAFDWDSFQVMNTTSGVSLNAVVYTDDMKKIVQQGGMVNMLKKRFAA